MNCREMSKLTGSPERKQMNGLTECFDNNPINNLAEDLKKDPKEET